MGTPPGKNISPNLPQRGLHYPVVVILGKESYPKENIEPVVDS